MLCVVCFFFKQKTAYEMRISDWSSDVCSSVLYFSPRLVVTRYLVATPSFSRSETVKSPVSSPSASAVRDWTLSSGASSAASALVEAKKTKENAAAVAMILGIMSFFLGCWSRTDPTARRWQRPVGQRSEERRGGKECGSK